MSGRIPFARGPSIAGRPFRTVDKAERDRFYSSAAWRKLRAAFLMENPLCVPCEAKGIDTPATTVHHRVERLADRSLALDWENLESACSACHTAHHKRKHHEQDRPESGRMG